MKRRNFLKGLSILPIGIDALREKAEEGPKPEPPKVKESKPMNPLRLRQKLGPQEGVATCSSYTWPAGSGPWGPWEK